MPVAALPPRHADTAAAALPTLHRFSVAQYLQLIESGTLGKYDRVELIDGWVVDKMSRNAPHDSAILRLQRRISRILPDEWLLRIQLALVLASSVPEPDLCIVHGPEETYDRRRPTGSEAALAIEVADSSVVFDRDEKGALYAEAGIPLYWLVNLMDRRLEVYSQPRAGRQPGYRRRKDLTAGDVLSLVLAKEIIGQISVAEILPR